MEEGPNLSKQGTPAQKGDVIMVGPMHQATVRKGSDKGCWKDAKTPVIPRTSGQKGDAVMCGPPGHRPKWEDQRKKVDQQGAKTPVAQGTHA